mmetsp:Transcript_24792/g.68623  ORF Transcript_24792/g.68623 Transcript_24792/m.68623 type:complete len:214 (-) Transcript_24792:36-677(-)
MRLQLLSMALIFVGEWANSEVTSYKQAKQVVEEFRARRIKQIDSMLKDAKRRLADHNSGQQPLLENDERISLERKVELYTRKVDLISEPGSDRNEMERILRREKLRDERRRQRNKNNHNDDDNNDDDGQGGVPARPDPDSRLKDPVMTTRLMGEEDDETLPTDESSETPAGDKAAPETADDATLQNDTHDSSSSSSSQNPTEKTKDAKATSEK